MTSESTAAESGPAHGLPKLVDAVREGVEKRCSDVIVATLLDSTAGALAELGDHGLGPQLQPRRAARMPPGRGLALGDLQGGDRRAELVQHLQEWHAARPGCGRRIMHDDRDGGLRKAHTARPP